MDEKDFAEARRVALEALEYLDKASSTPVRLFALSLMVAGSVRSATQTPEQGKQMLSMFNEATEEQLTGMFPKLA